MDVELFRTLVHSGFAHWDSDIPYSFSNCIFETYMVENNNHHRIGDGSYLRRVHENTWASALVRHNRI